MYNAALTHIMAQFSKPHTILIMAMSLDGKITTRDGAGPRFASKVDQIRLRELRAQADAILVGAGTIIADDPSFTERGKYREMRLQRGLAPNPIKAVVSGSGGVPETARMFQSNGASALVFTTERIPRVRLEKLKRVAEVYIVGETRVDFRRAVEILATRYNARRLLVEGGGQINFEMFQASLIDEVYLTLCPKIIGGKDIPTIVEGEGFDFRDIVDLELQDYRAVGQEIFLSYRICRGK